MAETATSQLKSLPISVNFLHGFSMFFYGWHCKTKQQNKTNNGKRQ